jgi:hypothetical protein
MALPYAWIDELAAEGVAFRAVHATPEARREVLPPSDDLGIAWTPRDAQADAAFRAAAIPVASGPARHDVFGREDHCVVLVHPAEPDRLYVALHRRYPAALWIPIASKAGFARALATYFSPPAADPPPAVTRVSLGLVQDVYALEERFLDHNPYCEGYGSDEALAADAGAAGHRFTVRTLHSHARIEVSSYGNLVTATIAYAPADDAETITTCNRAHGRRFPADLPVDAAAALIEHPVATGADILQALHASAPSGLQTMAVLTLELIQAPLTQSDLEAVAGSDDAELRRAVRTVAERRGFHALVERMRAAG